MGWYTDMNGLPIYVDETTGQITTPVSQSANPTPSQPAQSTTTPTPSTSEPWKPDFRSPDVGGPASGDPWEGMPGDYGGVENGTFT